MTIHSGHDLSSVNYMHVTSLPSVIFRQVQPHWCSLVEQVHSGFHTLEEATGS